MEQLTVRDCDHLVRHTAACFRRAYPAEILAAAANLDGAETVSLDGANVGPGVPDDEIELSVYVKREKGVDWFRHNVQVLLIPLPDKETPDVVREAVETLINKPLREGLPDKETP